MDGGTDMHFTSVREVAQPELPEYLINTYTWAYLRPMSVALLDNGFVVGSILWGNFRRLARSAFSEFQTGQRVL